MPYQSYAVSLKGHELKNTKSHKVLQISHIPSRTLYQKNWNYKRILAKCQHETDFLAVFLNMPSINQYQTV